MAAKQIVSRQRFGKGFVYSFNDSPVSDKEELAYFKSLGIPPAWKDVKIYKNRGSKITATGIDSAGRLQYVYHPSFRAKKDKQKFERILRFARALPQMRKTTNQHLRHTQLDQQKVLACVLQLMDKAYFRVGNEIYAKENQSYGLTTIRSKHTTVRGDTIVFNYMGKSGQPQLKKVTDSKLAKVIKQMDELPGYEIFKYYDDEGSLREVDSNDVNDYIKEVMGEEFSAKDFRTWGGTLLAAAELANAERAKTVHERKKTVTVCVANVAAKLGNTPAICRSSYIDPRVINAFVKTNDLFKVRQTVEQMDNRGELSRDEHCVLSLLEKAAA